MEFNGSHCVIKYDEAQEYMDNIEYEDAQQYEFDDVYLTKDQYDNLPEFTGF